MSGVPRAPTDRPTFWFIGVSTGQSSIMSVFPAWAEHLGLGDVEIRGMDLPLHAPAAAYREAVGHFAATGAEAFAIGAGGASIALTWCLMQAERGEDRPSRIIVSDPSRDRLGEIRRIHRALDLGVACEYVSVAGTADNDAVLAGLAPGALVVNATGLGKDAPGSPLGAAARFPERAVVWDLNYRGELLFLAQARAQRERAGLRVEDGWIYFIHGWTRVMAEVFDVEVPVEGPGFEELSRIATEAGEPAAVR